MFILNWKQNSSLACASTALITYRLVFMYVPCTCASSGHDPKDVLDQKINVNRVGRWLQRKLSSSPKIYSDHQAGELDTS